MVCFDTNILVYATASISDMKVTRSRDLIARAMRSASSVLLLDAVRAHRLAFWDAMLWASAHRAGVRYLVTEDLQDGFTLEGVTFVNPFKREHDRLIDELLPPS